LGFYAMAYHSDISGVTGVWASIASVWRKGTFALSAMSPLANARSGEMGNDEVRAYHLLGSG
jgi:hypothetical protein